MSKPGARAMEFKPVELADVCDKVSVGLASAVTPFIVPLGIKLIRNQNIRPNDFDGSSLIFIDPKFAASQPDKRVRRGDVVIVRTGANIGDACVVPDDFDGAQTFTTLIARPRPDLLVPEYLAQFINSPLGRSEVTRLMAGGGKGNLNSGQLQRLRILLPHLADQKKIAGVLTLWDSALSILKKSIGLRESRHLYHVSRLINRSQHPKTTLSTLARETSTRNRHCAYSRVLTVTNDRGFVLPEDHFGRPVASEDLSNYKLITKGQYAFNPSRINVGSIARLDKFETGVLSPMYVVFELDEKQIVSDYFLHWLGSHDAKEAIKNSAQGSVRETVSFSQLAATKIPIPTLHEQSLIARYLNAIQAETNLLRNLSVNLQKQKKGLIQRLLLENGRSKNGWTR